LQKKQCGSSYQSSQESADSKRWEDTLGEILGGIEARGRLRGIGYGAPSKEYLPESPSLPGRGGDLGKIATLNSRRWFKM
jgi:hypothetical protein